MSVQQFIKWKQTNLFPRALQRNLRAGATASTPISKHQSLKFSYARSAYIRFGGDYQSVSLAWQDAWVGRRLK